ncbi:hypothetical protein H5410_006116 [Solanum commersonii]|uniref:Uncharacterized protein n=1 Tax=Solanum commersonii TaxID=4109 RepID=A0A9J6A9G3_SOLCO|nr:hypothetical protein H5410_006116 [Solanum commersonii]
MEMDLHIDIYWSDLIAFNVQILGQFLHQPKKSHLESAMKIVRYVEAMDPKQFEMKQMLLEMKQFEHEDDFIGALPSQQVANENEKKKLVKINKRIQRLKNL